MTDYNASQNAMKWMANNPEKVAAQKKKRADRKVRLQKDAIRAHKRTPHKTPLKAIKAYCNQCPSGQSRGGFTYAPVECTHKSCPLYAYRNFNAPYIGRNDLVKARSCRKGNQND